MPTFALIATMRNEGPFILEWLAYHRMIGFSDIVVCTNACVDGSPELLDRLAERGLVTHLPCLPGPDDKPQLHAYGAAQALLEARPSDWTMVLDADEFLNVHVGAGRVSDLVFAAPDATAFLVNWRIFGDSGHRRWSPELVTRRFTRCAARSDAVNLSFKTLFSLWGAYHCPVLPHGPGYAREERLAELSPVSGSGEPLAERYARSEGFLQSEPDQVSWALAQVNHYNTRSWQDYLVKHDRGGGLSYERWDRDWNWAAFNKNDEVDLSIQQRLDELAAAVDDLLTDAETAALNARCHRLYGTLVDLLVQADA